MKLLFVVNGKCEKITEYLPKKFFKDFNKIICVDGGLNNLNKINNKIIPDYVFGDFDSLDEELLFNYKNKKTTIIKKDNQDETDLSFAVSYFLKKYKSIDKIVILCGTGNRFDHTICNILLFKDINIKTKIIGDNEEIYLLKNELKIKNKLGKTLSIIPITDVKNIHCTDLKWPLNNMNLNFGFTGGISNIIENNSIKLTIKSGLAVVIVNLSV